MWRYSDRRDILLCFLGDDVHASVLGTDLSAPLRFGRYVGEDAINLQTTTDDSGINGL